MHLFFRMSGARLSRLWRLAVFDPAFVTQITSLLRFLLAFWRFAVLISLLFNKSGGFFYFSLDAHVGCPFRDFVTVIRAIGKCAKGDFDPHRLKLF
jgi:hypothetical protein